MVSAMKRTLVGILALHSAAGLTQGADPPAAFKLGSFERGGKPFVGIVVRDAVVIDLVAADAALGGDAGRPPSYPRT